MAKKKPAGKTPAGRARQAARAASKRKSSKAIGIKRVETAVARATRDVSPADDVPSATIAAAGGPVMVAISFGQAQHGQYTIQLFDPPGTRELLRQPGLNTDPIPDQFVLQATPAQLDQHILQWSGAVSAFSPAPGQTFSVTFDVLQNGRSVPGVPPPRTGPLNVTQAFVGILRLVTR